MNAMAKFGMAAAMVLLVAVLGCGGGDGEPSETPEAAEPAKAAETSKPAASADKAAAAKVAEKILEAGLSDDDTKVDLDIDSKSESFSMKVSGDDGNTQMTMGPQTTIPSDFPKDVPLYPDMELLMVTTVSEDNAYNIHATSKDPLDKVAEYFQEKAGQEGWTEGLTMNRSAGQPTSMLTYSKGKRTLQVMAVFEDGVTHISITTAGR